MTLFTISKTDGDIASIEFNPSMQPGHDRSLFDVVDHDEQADALASSSAEIASIILVADALESELWSDTAFATWTARVGACEARVEARRRLMQGRIGPDHVEARALELGFPAQGSSDGGDSDFRTQVFDAIIEEEEIRAVMDILDKERNSCRFDWSDELDDEGRWAHTFAALATTHGVACPNRAALRLSKRPAGRARKPDPTG
jgi:hypothetical protein